MTVLLDASAIVAMAMREPEADEFVKVVGASSERLCCAVGVWEATLAIARKRKLPVALVIPDVEELTLDLKLRVVPIGEPEGRAALDAFIRFGKGTGHKAQLNMGDCFAYACAKLNGARLVYKGDDFTHTDLA